MVIKLYFFFIHDYNIILIEIIIFIRLSVDDDKFLHNETDPRYRGASIPSRSFRMLQTLTNSAPGKIRFIKFLCDCHNFIYTNEKKTKMIAAVDRFRFRHRC